VTCSGIGVARGAALGFNCGAALNCGAAAGCIELADCEGAIDRGAAAARGAPANCGALVNGTALAGGGASGTARGDGGTGMAEPSGKILASADVNCDDIFMRRQLKWQKEALSGDKATEHLVRHRKSRSPLGAGKPCRPHGQGF
jgi:hypothetical protein